MQRGDVVRGHGVYFGARLKQNMNDICEASRAGLVLKRRWQTSGDVMRDT